MFRRLLCGLSAFLIILEVLLAPAAFADEEEIKPAPPEFTSEEKQYIDTHETVRIGYVRDRIPVSFSDKNGEFAGISRYIFDQISDICGMKFEYVPLPAGDVTYDYLLGEGLELVSSVEYNEENQSARGILISNPYLSGRKVVVAKEGMTFDRDAHMSVAISTGSQTLRKVFNRVYPNFELVDYPSITACFDAVNNGEADLMMQNQYVAEHWIVKPIYENLKLIPVTGLDDKLCFSAVVAFGSGNGASEADGMTLINILNKAIASMSEDEVWGYTIQSVMENQYVYTVSDFLYRYCYAVRVLITALIIIGIMTVLLFRLHISYVENKADARVKSRFLSTMSHEIRTPLNGLIGLNHLMEQNSDNKEKLGQYLKQSTMTANYLLSLLNDMLDMSTLQTKTMELCYRPVDLNLLMNTVSSITESATSDKGQIYNADYDLEWPYILGDAARIQQVLLHLLDNARKFTQTGGEVNLQLTQEQRGDGKVVTTAVIYDNGYGMSDEIQKHVFDAFARELDTVSKGTQGAGLGLSISRRLAKLMGGDITFVSKKGYGSAFTFTFAAHPTDPPEEPVQAAPNDNGERARMRILVAEDNELNAEIITELLQEAGFETELAQNGEAALKMFSDSKIGEFSVILMDLLMPIMDGFEAAKAIRSLKRPDAETVRIFACTANSSPEDEEKAMASGMDDFFTKPVDIAELIKKIDK